MVEPSCNQYTVVNYNIILLAKDLILDNHIIIIYNQVFIILIIKKQLNYF